ncbi:two-partner secretion domain-containing protein, partial [Pseudothauera rhizosphaerae]
MNKRCFRVVFNKTRAVLMAVAETARCRGKSAPARGGAPASALIATLRPVAFRLLAALGGVVWLPPLQAQIVADPAAAAGQRPAVSHTANGVPLVDIQKPSAAGVSRNTYRQFDVDGRGAILNNSRTNVQTRLGGWVQGNPHLAGGTARIILNEVNSANPSLLHGYVEVAGSRAQVVIANPAGIHCDGCGFINASRSTLTTGTPLVDGGNLLGYRVGGGTIRIEGQGLDDTATAYTDIIARAVETNAGIWANALSVTTGANRIDIDAAGHQTAATPITPDDGAAPAAFALDVAALGGMYAGKIHLIGTEAGLGVRNAGRIGAAAGEVVLSVDGRLLNTGTLQAQGAITLHTPDGIDNRGGLIRSADALTIETDRLINAGTLAADQGIGGKTVSITAHHIDNHAGAMRADTTLAIASGGTLDNGEGLIAAGQHLTLRDGAAVKTLAITGTGGTLAAGGNLTVEGRSLTSSDVLGGGNLHLHLTGDYTNTGWVQAGGTARVQAGGALANHGTLLAGSAFELAAAHIDNTGGLIRSADALTLETDRLINTGTQGEDQGIGGKTVSIAARDLDNRAGRMQAETTLNIASHGTLDNSEGLIAAGSLTLRDTDPAAKALQITNTGGTLAAAGALTVDSRGLTGDGDLLSAGSLHIRLIDDYANTGWLQAHGTADLRTAGTITNRSALLAGGALQLAAATLDNAGGLIRSADALTIETDRLTNTGTRGEDQGIEGRTVAIAAHELDNSTGAIRAVEALNITSHGTLDNSGGLIAAGNLTLRDGAAAKALAVTNTGGTLAAADALSVDSHGLTGDGDILSTGDIDLRLIGDYTHTGHLQADGDLRLETAGTLTNAAELLAGEALYLQAATLDNRAAGRIVGGQTRLLASASLTNCGLIDGQSVRVDTASLHNLGTGRLYGDHIALAATALEQRAEGEDKPVIAARERLDIGAQTLVNDEGAQIFSAEDLAIGGALDADGRATGSADTLTNTGATIEALGNLDIAAQTLRNLNAGLTTKQSVVGTTHYDKFTPSDTSVLLDTADYPGAKIGDVHTEWRYVGSYRFRQYRRYVYSGTTTETKVNQSRPGSLRSGGGLRLTGNVTNQDSRIIAGGALDITGATLDNLASEGTRITTYSGTAYFYDYDGHKSCSSSGGCYDIDSWSYNPAATLETFALPAGEVVEYARAPGSDAESPSASPPAAQPNPDLPEQGAPDLEVPEPALPERTVPGTGVATLPVGQLRLDLGGLFQPNPDPQGGYLIETDPRFADYRQWLSSTYLLDALGLDPADTQKRLGDGFYEQRLIREQIAQLTGRRYLAGYADDESQYLALMNAGVTFAEALQLVPGVALSPEQIAQLTSDIVWLVEQTVTLPDGTTARALVPQVYVQVRPGDLEPSTGLMAGNEVRIDLTGDFTNSGTVAGRSLLALDADNLRNLGGTLAADGVRLDAINDLTHLGGSIIARDALVARAGGDLTAASTVHSSTAAQGASRASRTNLDRVAGFYVTGDAGILLASAGNDLTLAGALIHNAGADGQTLVTAGRDLNLSTVTEADHIRSVRNSRNYVAHGGTREVGTQIEAAGDLTLAAGNNLTARAATVSSEAGALTAAAGNDLTLEAGRETYAFESARRTKKSGTFSSSTKTERLEYEADTSVGSSFAGRTVDLQAGRDLTVSASMVVSDEALALTAMRDVILDTAQDLQNETRYRKESRSGFTSSMGSIGYGTSSLQENGKSRTVTQATSTLSGENVAIASGRDTVIRAGAVLADQDVTLLAGRNVDLLAAADTQHTETHFKSKSSGHSFSPDLFGKTTIYSKTSASQDGTGSSTEYRTSLLSANSGNLTVRAGLDDQHKETGQGNVTTQGADLLAGEAITVSGNAIDLQAVAGEASSHVVTKTKSFTLGARAAGLIGGRIAALGDAVERARDTDNDRLKGALALKAGYDGWKLSQGVSTTTTAAGEAAQKDAPTGAAFGVQVYVGTSKSKSESDSRTSTVTGTNLQAKTIDLTATETDLQMAAAKLQAEEIRLAAQRDIHLQAAANTSTLRNTNKSSSAGVGVTFGFGQQNGFSIQLNAGQAKGRANGTETVWDNTLITATDTLTVTSGRDTT